MRGHVVGPLGIMSVVWNIFGNEFIEMPLQVRPYRRIGVLVDSQGRGRVLDKEMKYPPPNGGELGEPGDDLGCYKMEPKLPGLERDLLLNKRHGGIPLCALAVL